MEKIDQEQFAELRHTVEYVTGCKMCTPKNFNLLSVRIYDRTHVSLSPSTLKRFWGYATKDESSNGMRRKSTFDVLSRYAGFADWDAFCQRDQQPDAKDASNLFFGHKQITADSMQPGDTLIVIWKPNRRITLRYVGNSMWMVVDSKNSKLSVGDTFKCHIFIEHQPLVLSDLIHDNLPPCGYICGKNGGINFMRPSLEKP